MSNHTKSKFDIKCPKCGAAAEMDLTKMPPKQIGKNLEVHFVCECGNKFVHIFVGK